MKNYTGALDAVARQVANALDAIDQEDGIIPAKLKECPWLHPDVIRLEVGPVDIARVDGLPVLLTDAVVAWAVNYPNEARYWLARCA